MQVFECLPRIFVLSVSCALLVKHLGLEIELF